MRKIIIFKILLLLTGVFNVKILNAQNDSSAITLNKVVYQFKDASVPPRFHRSYDIILDSHHIKLAVNSYGRILLDTLFPANHVLMDSVSRLAAQAVLNSSKNKTINNNGCVGGTGESLILYAQHEVVFEGNVYHCGGDDYKDFTGDFHAIAAYLRKLIPGFPALVE